MRSILLLALLLSASLLTVAPSASADPTCPQNWSNDGAPAVGYTNDSHNCIGFGVRLFDPVLCPASPDGNSICEFWIWVV